MSGLTGMAPSIFRELLTGPDPPSFTTLTALQPPQSTVDVIVVCAEEKIHCPVGPIWASSATMGTVCVH